jgi:hypothetical protein
MQKGGGHDSACCVFREPTKRAESTHTHTHTKRREKKRRERRVDRPSLFGMRGSAPFCWLAGAFSSSSSSSSPFFFVAVITFVSLRYSQLLPPSDPAPPSFFSLIPYSIRHISHTKAQKRSIHPSLNGSGEGSQPKRNKKCRVAQALAV